MATISKDLQLIKKHYGEKFMHLCRKLFPTLLEQEGLLYKTISNSFSTTRSLYNDIINNDLEEDFKNLIYFKSHFEKEKKISGETRSPEELLDIAGYVLYPECTTEKEIQSFKKYYKQDERICTFNGGRLSTCRVWFAVKKNVNEIKRDNFKNPQRQDEYGTSVISIQFTKGDKNTLSIKNRYNHTVNNPDATFSNDLDNIIPGLTEAFENKYNLNINSSDSIYFDMPNYVLALDGKHYRYNYEINNIYYCENNIIIDNFEARKLPQHKLLIDYFIFDLKEKTIELYDNNLRDSFVYSLGNIQSISINGSVFSIHSDKLNSVEFEVDKHGCISKFSSEDIVECDDYLFSHNRYISELNLSNVKILGNACFSENELLKSLDMQNLINIGDWCFYHNEVLSIINLPKAEVIGDSCFSKNRTITEIMLPSLKYMGNDCFGENETINKIDFPNLIKMGNWSFNANKLVKSVYLPKLERIGTWCFSDNNSIQEVNMSSVKEIGKGCFARNIVIQKIVVPNDIKLDDFNIYWRKLICDSRLKNEDNKIL